MKLCRICHRPLTPKETLEVKIMRQESILGEGPAFHGKVIRIDKLPEPLRSQFVVDQSQKQKQEHDDRELEIRTSEARRRSELEGV